MEFVAQQDPRFTNKWPQRFSPPERQSEEKIE